MLNKDIYIIVPVFNEAKIIRQVVLSLLGYNYSVVVIDDASTDSTIKCLAEMPIHLLKHEVNLGQGAAIQTGIDYAILQNAKIFVTFDGDGQHNAKDIVNLIQPLLMNEADVVLGSRFLPTAFTNVSFFRRVAIQTAIVLNFMMTGLLLSDAHNGLRAFNTKAANLFDLKENSMAHASEILFKVNKYKLRYKEIPVTILYTEYSRRKGQSLLNSVRVFFDIVLNRIFE